MVPGNVFRPSLERKENEHVRLLASQEGTLSEGLRVVTSWKLVADQVHAACHSSEYSVEQTGECAVPYFEPEQAYFVTGITSLLSRLLLSLDSGYDTVYRELTSATIYKPSLRYLSKELDEHVECQGKD